VGQTAITARALLLQESFQVEIVTEESDAVAADTVIAQDPAPGTAADPGAKVTLRVAASSGKLAVPDVAGKTPDEANQTLATTGFRTSVQSEGSATVAKGVVVRTDPAAGALVAKGGAVVIYVSAGTDVAVPSVIASTEADAVARLVQLGFAVDRRTRIVTTATDIGVVLEQTPKGGTNVVAGSTVSIVVGIVDPALLVTTTTAAPTTTVAPSATGVATPAAPTAPPATVAPTPAPTPAPNPAPTAPATPEPTTPAAPAEPTTLPPG
jgi:serine/threonine-protein kinase